MIDPKMFDRDKLVALLATTDCGSVNQWLRLVEIVPDYMPPFPRADARPTIQVRCLVNPNEPAPGPGVCTGRYSYLRGGGHAGWLSGGYFWDCYGTEWHSVEHALVAVIHAPVPPQLLKPLCWEGK